MKANSELLRRVSLLRKYASRLGVKTVITSTVRTRKQQAQLYANRSSNPYPVSPPGYSAHEYGLAADIVTVPSEYQTWLSSISGNFGLFSYPGDEIHFQIISRDAFRSLLARFFSGGT